MMYCMQSPSFVFVFIFYFFVDAMLILHDFNAYEMFQSSFRDLSSGVWKF